MPKPCSVCTHKERGTIDLRLALPTVNLAQLEREYGVGRDSLRRHKERHVPELLRTWSRSAAMPDPGKIMAELQHLYERALDSLARAEAGVLIGLDEDGYERRRVSPTAIQGAIREARATLESIAKLAARETETERVEQISAPELSHAIAKALESAARRAARGMHDAIEDAQVVEDAIASAGTPGPSPATAPQLPPGGSPPPQTEPSPNPLSEMSNPIANESSPVEAVSTSEKLDEVGNSAETAGVSTSEGGTSR